ncbi:MAG TPA: hypothetical protein VLH13_02645, partial [Methanomassiliicoccales archaeon]|nr:hypothetical protein [Methanomassiliicoccales archaeon]
TYDLATKVLRSLAEIYDTSDIAHAKVMLQSEGNDVKMSAVLSNITVDAVRGSRYAQGDVLMTVNARIVSSPEKLREAIRTSVQRSLERSGVALSGFEDECFSPSRPNPTHRMIK